MSQAQIKGSHTSAGVLSVALDIGQYMIKYGGGVHRAEDTVARICRAYGAEQVEIWAIDSMICATVYMTDEDYSTQTRRITSAANHLARLEALNSLSREICRDTPPAHEVKAKISEIRKLRPIHPAIHCAAGALGAGAFAIFFGGSYLDGLSAAVIGLVMTALSHLEFINANAMVRSFVLSFCGGVLANAFYSVGFGNNLDKIAIGAIMLVIPGMAFFNAIRDVMYGDNASGTMGFSKALVCALMVVLGYVTAFMLCNQLALLFV